MKWGANLFSKNPITALKENKKKELVISLKRENTWLSGKGTTPVAIYILGISKIKQVKKFNYVDSQ